MSTAKSGENNPMYRISRNGMQNPFYGKTHSIETREKMSVVKLGHKNNPTIPVTILDLETSITTTYDSIDKAALAINSHTKSLWRLSHRKNPNAPYRGRYIITIHRNNS